MRSFTAHRLSCIRTPSPVARRTGWCRVCLVVACAVVYMVMLPGCSPWPTIFEEIDDHRPRVLDFVYKNSVDTTLCEAAPGDTLILDAWYAGQPLQTLSFEVSFDLLKTPLGQDTAMNRQPLNAVSRETIYAGNARCERLRFVIPRSILSTHPLLRDAAVQQMVQALGVPSIDLMTIALDTLARISPDMRAAFALLPYDSLKPLLPLLMQFTSLPIRIFALANGVHETRSDFSVRYNRFFIDVDNIHVNHNPLVRFAAIYKVKNPVAPGWKPASLTASDTTLCLYASDPIAADLAGPAIRYTDSVLIDTGYTYFTMVDSGVVNGVSQLDRCVTFSTGSATFGQVTAVEPELFFAQWFYELDNTIVDSLSYNDKPRTGGQPLSVFVPPLNTAIREVRMWVQLYDQYLGERNRPLASSLRDFTVRFRYTTAYAAQAASQAGALGLR